MLDDKQVKHHVLHCIRPADHEIFIIINKIQYIYITRTVHKCIMQANLPLMDQLHILHNDIYACIVYWNCLGFPDWSNKVTPGPLS